MTESDNQIVGVREYERRHAELEQRIIRLETIVANLVTQKDLADFRATVMMLQDSVADFRTTSTQLPTKEELKYLKWLVAGASGLMVYHMFGGQLPPFLGLP